MTVSQYDHVVPYTDLGGRGYFGVNAALVFDLRLNKRLNKQSLGWWFETPSHPLWRYCNVQSKKHGYWWLGSVCRLAIGNHVEYNGCMNVLGRKYQPNPMCRAICSPLLTWLCHQLDDEYHILLECNLLQDLRKRLIPKYNWHRPSMIKCLELLKCNRRKVTRNLAKFVYIGFTRKNLMYMVIDQYMLICHDDVIKWKHFPSYWPFVREIHRSPVNSPYKGQWRGALLFSLICAPTNSWPNNGDAGDLRRHRTHYYVIVMWRLFSSVHWILEWEHWKTHVVLNWQLCKPCQFFVFMYMYTWMY